MLPSLLFMLPVVVVNVGGDRLDPAHTRSLVAKELEVEAIAADDPRAAEATGRVDIVSKDGKLTVRYRKVDGPIERSIPVASDPARAEIDAAYLAGNLARDEASELAPSGEPKSAEPKPVDANAAWSEDDHRYAQLRAYVGDLSRDAKTTSFRGGALLTVAGGLMLAPAIYVTATGGLDEPSGAGLAGASVVTAALFIGIGIGAMVGKNDPYEPLVKAVREQDARKASSEDALAGVEAEWKRQIDSERSAHKTSAILSFVIAGLCIGGGAVSFALDSDESAGRRETDAFLMVAGGVNVIAGIAALITEGPMERTHKQWHSVSNPGASTVGFGFAPTFGGGAASFSVRF